MTKKNEWIRQTNLKNSGFEVKPSAIRVHGRNETPEHLVVKAMIALKLQRAGRRWDTEVKTPAGRVDVLDHGPPDGKAVVYEVQTDASPKEAREKASQYDSAPVRDVIVVDPTEAPGEPRAIIDWLDNFMIGLDR